MNRRQAKKALGNGRTTRHTMNVVECISVATAGLSEALENEGSVGILTKRERHALEVMAARIKTIDDDNREQGRTIGLDW